MAVTAWELGDALDSVAKSDCNEPDAEAEPPFEADDPFDVAAVPEEPECWAETARVEEPCAAASCAFKNTTLAPNANAVAYLLNGII